ncbi:MULTISPECIES: D-serine ammonia-lyase [Shouchella]|uniref:Probable D-serine dehydratase n=2 Tax=Shouchella TaxID=2893057 RepID=A0ABY7W109_9BACI|nr:MULTISPECIES: D-serine ammonia-lyase [Shouchella]MED4127683.1 D-serine ammonia-lyase [Shouchella miscanthi]WDF02632.1 D-serine ammonia-lyase [Shouchella hunanensis]
MTRERLLKAFPNLTKLTALEEYLWINTSKGKKAITKNHTLSMEAILEAEARLNRFAPYISLAFPETERTNGLLESPLLAIDSFQQSLEEYYQVTINGSLFLKGDHLLPISGSIKARGGIYEVLTIAEKILIEESVFSREESYEKLIESTYQDVLSRYTIVVGSTGNLGLSIGVMGAKLGFNVIVHMSSDAKAWKKALLQQKGAHVVEHDQDYSLAVEEGRKQAEANVNSYFIDDEHSTTLFLGYAVAALRLKKQLDEKGITINRDHPLIVYLPCGVGGGPGGIAYGLHQVFGENVTCYFAEPTHSPCMLVGMMTGLHENIHVKDIGIDNRTIADGLAVGRPSGFVGKVMEPILGGIYTVNDETMYKLLAMLIDQEEIALEPSAVTALFGPVQVANSAKDAVHLAWATGGSMVPTNQMQHDYEIGKALLN